MRKLVMTLVFAFAAIPMFAQVDFYKGSWDQVLAKAQKENKIVMVDFWATWCGPCRAMAARTFTDSEVGTVQNKNFISYKIDAEKGEGPKLARKYRIRAYPTYIFVDGNGKVVFTSQGYQPKTAWLETLQDAAKASGFKLSSAAAGSKGKTKAMPNTNLNELMRQNTRVVQAAATNNNDALSASLDEAHNLGRSNNEFDLDEEKKSK